MPIQTGILPAGSTLTVDYSIGETATISYQDGDIGVVDNGQTKTTDRTIGPFANDVPYSIDYTGWPKVFTTAAGGAITTISLPLPDPATLGAGATVVVDGNLMVVSDGKFKPVTQRGSRRLCLIGDSYTANALNYSTTNAPKLCAKGWITHALYLSSHALELVKISASGGMGVLSGSKTFDAQLTEALALNPSHITIMGGVNDAFDGRTYNAIVAEYQALIERALMSGVTVWLLTQPGPDSTYSQYTAAKMAVHLKVQNWLRQYAANSASDRLYLIDTAAVATDPASITMGYKSGFGNAGDGIHPTNRCAYAMGKAVADVWSNVLPPNEFLPRSNYDNYTFNAISDGVMQNTNLLLSSGGLASQWTTGVTAGAAIGTLSLESRADGFGNNQVVPMTFTADKAVATLTSTPYSSAVVDGDTFYAVGEVQLVSPVNIRAVIVELWVNGNLVNKYFQGGYSNTAGDAVENSDVPYLSGFTWKFKTPPLQYVASVQGPTKNVMLKFSVMSGAATGSCTLKFGRPDIRKVIA